MFLCGYDEITEYFDNIYICMARPFQIVQTISEKLDLDKIYGNKVIFYELRINFLTQVIVQIEQYFDDPDQEPLPLRMIIAKNVSDKITYICGRG